MISWLKPEWPVQRSKCGRYMVVRATRGDDETPPWFCAYELHGKSYRVVGEYRSESDARAACEAAMRAAA